MTPGKEVCPVHDLAFRTLQDDVAELKDRVRRVESAIARGVMLLVANLVGIVLALAQQALR